MNTDYVKYFEVEGHQVYIGIGINTVTHSEELIYSTEISGEPAEMRVTSRNIYEMYERINQRSADTFFNTAKHLINKRHDK